MKKKILITGSSGFIGKNFISVIAPVDRFEIHLAVRSSAYPKYQNCFEYVLGDFADSPNWDSILDGIDTVIHIAGFAHSREKNLKKLELLHYRSYLATHLLIESAAKAGVKKFIYLSSIGVNGNSDGCNKLKYSDTANPLDIYSKYKLFAEQKLMNVCSTVKMSYVILRPPLVYGPSAPGNIKLLLDIIKYIKFLPLPESKNKRSLLYVGNLVDLLLNCIDNPNADNKIFLASDDSDFSIAEIAGLIAEGNQIKICIFPIHTKILIFLLRFFFLEKKFKKFINPLQADIEYTKLTLNWLPPFKASEKLKEIR